MSNKYRQVQVSFWQDAFVLDLTPEEKYFYIYLMSNSKATQIGIYELPFRVMEMETGYNRETVEKLLNRFIEYGKIDYHEPTKEIILLNWAKHNWNNSTKIVSRVEKELEDIKHIPFVEKYLEIVSEIKSDKVSIQYQYPIDNAPIQYGSDKGKNVDTPTFDTSSIPYPYTMHTKDNENDKEKNKEKDKDKDNENDKESDIVTIIKFWVHNGFGYKNVNAKHKLLSWLDDLNFKNPSEMILKALDIASTNDRRTLAYVEGILRNWTNESILTIAEVDRRNKGGATNESRNYDESVGDYGVKLYK